VSDPPGQNGTGDGHAGGNVPGRVLLESFAENVRLRAESLVAAATRDLHRGHEDISPLVNERASIVQGTVVLPADGLPQIEAEVTASLARIDAMDERVARSQEIISDLACRVTMMGGTLHGTSGEPARPSDRPLTTETNATASGPIEPSEHSVELLAVASVPGRHNGEWLANVLTALAVVAVVLIVLAVLGTIG
jgi:hypothetical protein